MAGYMILEKLDLERDGKQNNTETCFMKKYCEKKKGNQIFMKVICEERHRDKEYGEHMILKRADKRVKREYTMNVLFIRTF